MTRPPTGSSKLMSGSDVEPVAEEAASQMQEATERLRDKAWMVAPMTNGAAVIAAAEITESTDA